MHREGERHGRAREEPAASLGTLGTPIGTMATGMDRLRARLGIALCRWEGRAHAPHAHVSMDPLWCGR